MPAQVARDITAGATSVRVACKLVKADNTEDTGLVAADLTANYYREGAASGVSISLSDATALNDAHSAGKVKETPIDAVYQLHVPDAAFASGASWVVLRLESADSFYDELVRLGDNQVDLDTIKGQAVTAAAAVTVPSELASPTNITAAAGVVLATAPPTAAQIWDFVPESTAPTPNALRAGAMLVLASSAENLAAAVWDVPFPDHNLASSMGSRLLAINVDEFADAVWDEPTSSHLVVGSFGEAWQIESRYGGDVVAATATTVVLGTNEGAADLAEWGVLITGGPGEGQFRAMVAYDPETWTGTVDRAWTTEPTNASTYLLYPPKSLAVGGLDLPSVEAGINVRQALRALLAPIAGEQTVPESGTVAYAAAGAPGTPRVSAAIDPDTGTRGPVTLTLGD